MSYSNVEVIETIKSIKTEVITCSYSINLVDTQGNGFNFQDLCKIIKNMFVLSEIDWQNDIYNNSLKLLQKINVESQRKNINDVKKCIIAFMNAVTEKLKSKDKNNSHDEENTNGEDNAKLFSGR